MYLAYILYVCSKMMHLYASMLFTLLWLCTRVFKLIKPFNFKALSFFMFSDKVYV